MNTGCKLLLLLLSVSLTAFAVPIRQPGKKTQPTHLARFEVGAYLTAADAKLRVNVNKQLGGRVFIQVIDPKGNVYFDRTMTPIETLIRLSLSLSELPEGAYMLKVSNGLDVVVRAIQIASPKPVAIQHTLTLF